MDDGVSGTEVEDAGLESAADIIRLQLTMWQQYL
jgi:hypothetical protein